MKRNLSYLLPSRCVKMVLLIGFLTLVVFSNYDGAQSKPTKPRMKIGAYYYDGWGGKNRADDGKPEHAWAKGMPVAVTKRMVTEFAGLMPIWGWRDDTQKILERQIDLAADNGLAFFSFCWYWADDSRPINIPKIESDTKNQGLRMFMQAKNNNRMEFCLLVANHNGFAIVGLDAWKQAADYWIKNYFKHPRYLCLEGKPLVVIFSGDAGNVQGFAYLQEAARKAGFPGVEIARCYGGRRDSGYTLRTDYNIVPGEISGISENHPYSELVEAQVRGWHGRPEQPYIPLAITGWDKRPWEGPDGQNGKPGSYFTGRTPEAFGNSLERMAKWMDEHPEQTTKDRLALIYAWNEMGEGGWLMPTKDDPKGAYLKAVRRVVLGK